MQANSSLPRSCTFAFALAFAILLFTGCLTFLTSNSVEAAEPGMLYHSQDADPNNPRHFIWTEIYADDAAFNAHLANPAVGKLFETVGPMLAGNMKIEVLFVACESF